MSTFYYKVELDGEISVVKANSAGQVRAYVTDVLKSRYSYARATTDEVIEYLEQENALEDLTIDVSDEEEAEATQAA
jgi:hypothetical protein